MRQRFNSFAGGYIFNKKGTKMAYKWKPSKSARKAFAIKMQTDTDFANDYNQRKADKAEIRRNASQFDYNTAGGYYIPSKVQHDFSLTNSHLFITEAEKEACNMVIYGYSCNEKVNHDYIHIVNEKIRSTN